MAAMKSGPPLGRAGIDVSLVVPFFNPGPIVRDTVERAAKALEAAGVSYEVIAVSDGSTDGSPAELAGLLPEVLKVVELPENRGKGWAVRTGFALARGALIGFLDADGDIPPEQLTGIVRVAAGGGADIVYGSKRHKGSEVEVPFARRSFTRLYSALIRRMFHLPVLDTQTGVKVMRAEVVRAVLPVMAEDRFAFDLELFVLAHDLGYGSFVAVPVRVEKAYRSTVSLKAGANLAFDSCRIYWRLRVRGRQASRDREAGAGSKTLGPGRS